MILRILLIILSISCLSGFASASPKKVVVIDLSQNVDEKGPHLTPKEAAVLTAEANLEARMLANFELDNLE